MEKTFTINVPDEIWVDSWNNDKIETYTYTGPDTVYVLISDKTDDIVTWSEDLITTDENSLDFVVEIDATLETMTSVAHYIMSNGAEHEYVYKEVTNHDGSVHTQFTNPVIGDYFDVSYNRISGVILEPVYKNIKTTAEEIAENRLAYVKKYDNIYDFGDTDQASIDAFVAKIDSYLTTMSDVFPWKYITIDNSNIPKVPVKLIQLFSTLPDIDAGE
jgi:hypothetical protein